MLFPSFTIGLTHFLDVFIIGCIAVIVRVPDHMISVENSSTRVDVLGTVNQPVESFGLADLSSEIHNGVIRLVGRTNLIGSDESNLLVFRRPRHLMFAHRVFVAASSDESKLVFNVVIRRMQ